MPLISWMRNYEVSQDWLCSMELKVSHKTPIHETKLFLKIWQPLSQSGDSAHFMHLRGSRQSALKTAKKKLLAAIFRKTSPVHILLHCGTAPQVSGTPTSSGELWRHWNNRTYGASKLRFPHTEYFSQNNPQLGTRPQKRASALF
jgi:hypothetical protein